MRGSLRIGRILGVPLSVHWSFSLLLVLVVLSSVGQPLSDAFWLVVWVVALFASVTVHEVSHCLVAMRRGLKVEGIVLLPIGGMSQISGLPGPPDVERDVALAGPLSSLLLAGVLALIGFAAGSRLWPPTLFTGSWLSRLAWLNLLLAAFNLLPALPMDGGRILRAVLAARSDSVHATRIATGVAQVLAVAMIAVGFFVDLWLSLIGIFVLFGANSERRLSLVQQAVSGLRVADVMAPDTTSVPAEVTVGELRHWLAFYPGRGLPVTEQGVVVGIVSTLDVAGRSSLEPVGSVCDRTSPILEPSTLLYPTMLEIVSRHARGEFAVAQHGRPVGVVYRSNLDALFERGRGTSRPRAA